MRIHSDLAELERGRPAILTIGAFDGVHRGHQYLMWQVVARALALRYESVVVTFDPRPQVVLRPGSKQLTGRVEKTRVIGAVGPDALVILPFNRPLSQVSAGEFFDSILDHVNLAEIWIGADFAFGHNREGNVDFLIHSGQQRGFGVHVVTRQQLGGTEISSTAIRELVEAGAVAEAAELLGHYLRLEGPVVTGAGRGAGLGFPTANLQLPDWQTVPGTGIYAGYVHLDGEVLPAAVSVGYNLQFGGKEIKVEAYVLDFDGDLRGRLMSLDLIRRIREEKRFESVDALVAAMHDDVEQVRSVLAAAEEPGEHLLLSSSGRAYP